MTAAATPVPHADATGRQRRLAQAVSGLRTRAAGKDPERWLLIAGGVLLPLGLLVILLGWIGASQTPRLFEQIPYMISGGLLGLGLVFAGGFTYFAYWMTRLIKEQRDQNAALLNALRTMERRLESFESRASFAPVSERSSVNGASTSSDTFVATQTGTMYHRIDCPVVTGKDDLVSVGAEDGYKPCRICEPHVADVH